MLKNHSDFSLLRSSTDVKKLVKQAAKLGHECIALTDYSSISGVVDFFDSCKKEKIKGIIGCQFLLKSGDYITVLARNEQGYKALLLAANTSNLPENIVDNQPTITLDELAKLINNCYIYTGYLGSTIYSCLYKEINSAIKCLDSKFKEYLNDSWEVRVIQHINNLKEKFGEENVFLSRDVSYQPPAIFFANNILEVLSKRLNIGIIAVNDCHFLTKELSRIHRTLLCVKYRCAFDKLPEVLNNTAKDYSIRFINSMNFYLHSKEEFDKLCKPEEIVNIKKICDNVETFSLQNQPTVPEFTNNEIGDMSQAEYLKHLCREGWKQKISGKIPKEDLPKYTEEIKKELDIVIGTGILPSYFLIVADYCNWARKQGMHIGERGSGAGCLISYLIGITNLDPVKTDLVFERFYNAGRNTDDKVSLPDIDVDFPKEGRESVSNYIKEKYGHDKVVHMLTFNTLKARGALKEVLTAHRKCTVEEMNRMTSNIPQEADISDQLQLMKDSGKQPSALLWTLENTNLLDEWCSLDSDGNLIGDFALEFQDALELEGVKKSPGKHASGLAISTVPLFENIPMVYDKHSGELVAGLEMNQLEYVGLPKLDVLGSLSLDKINLAERVVNDGFAICPEDPEFDNEDSDVPEMSTQN